MLFFLVDLSRQRPDVDPGILEEHHRGADILRRNGRQVALHIDHGFHDAVGIEPAERLVNPVRPGGMIAPRHDGFAAMGFDGRGDLRRVGGDRHAADLGRLGAAQDMHDHGQAGDIQ